jgi:putative hydrolase of the HAD superfamily
MAGWVLEALGLEEESRAGLADELERAFAEASLESEIAALDGSRKTLEWLAAAGLRRALVCDTGFSPGRVVRQLLARTDLLDLLEVLAFSDEVGVPKPEARIFEHALGALETAPHAALHVGDLRRTDIAGARRLGMRTVRIRDHFDDPSEHADADHVADSHAHLRELLATLARGPGA